MPNALLDDLIDWLRIPSISTGGGDPGDLERAAQWVVERVREAGGEAEAVRIGSGHPLVVGELRSADASAPTVLIYGHYDVQSIGDAAAWVSPPFAPEVRDGRVYARGASDDKGNFLPLLRAACELARGGDLPVHVRVLVEGEEEAGSEAVTEWVRADERGADAAIVYDSGMIDEATPAITVGLRGVLMTHVMLRTAERDLHSGMYGGSVLNALHVLHGVLAAVLPGPDGRLRGELREGIAEPSEAERASWAQLPPGDRLIAEAGGRPVHPAAGAQYYERNGADASLDVNEIRAGDPRTVIPAVAHATLSIRIAPRQDPEAIAATAERLMRERLPDGAELEMTWQVASPALFDVHLPAIRLAAEAIERATGTAPVLERSGGSIPVVAELAAKRIPTIVSGFALAGDGIHAPNESYRLESLALGEKAGREILLALAGLPRE